MGLEDIANIVTGLTSAAQGYMGGQEFVMKIQKQKDDADAQKITNILKYKQAQLEEAKMFAENAKLPYEIDKLKSEAEKNRTNKLKPEDQEKMYNWDAFKNMDPNSLPPLAKAYQDYGKTNNLTGDFTMPKVISSELENSYKVTAEALKRQQAIEDKTKEVGSKLTAEAGKLPAEALKNFRSDKSINTAITTLDQIKVGLADAFDEKGKFRTYEKRIKEDKEKNILGSVGMMQRLLAKVSDPNSAVRDLEEANMANKGSPVLDRIRAIVGQKVTGDVTKEEYNMMTFLISKYVKGNIDILENTAKNMLPSLQAESKALKDAGGYYPGSNVKAREITYDDLANSIPSLAFLKNADLPTAKKEKVAGQRVETVPINNTSNASSDKIKVLIDGQPRTISKKLYEAQKGNGRIKLVGSK